MGLTRTRTLRTVWSHSSRQRSLTPSSTWVVLFGSEFLVLEAVALVVDARVSLGGFLSLTLLILALLLSRAAVRRLLQRPHQRA